MTWRVTTSIYPGRQTESREAFDQRPSAPHLTAFKSATDGCIENLTVCEMTHLD